MMEGYSFYLVKLFKNASFNYMKKGTRWFFVFCGGMYTPARPK